MGPHTRSPWAARPHPGELVPTPGTPVREAAVGVRKPGGVTSRGTAVGRICVKENPVTSKGGLLSAAREREVRGRDKRGGSGDRDLLLATPRGAVCPLQCALCPHCVPWQHGPLDRIPIEAGTGRNNPAVPPSSSPAGAHSPLIAAQPPKKALSGGDAGGLEELVGWGTSGLYSLV